MDFPSQSARQATTCKKPRRRCVPAEDQFGLTVDGGVAGRQVLSALDGAFIGGVTATFGAALARSDAPFALSKVQAAINALMLIGLPLVQSNRTRGTIPQDRDALRIHFRLVNFPATIGVAGWLPTTISVSSGTRSTLFHEFSKIAVPLSGMVFQ